MFFIGVFASDSIGDDWQVQFFGLDNPASGPMLDPDGDTHKNLFEFTAGIEPNNARSVFNWRMEPVPGQPGQRNLVFSPIIAGRIYTVKSAPTLGVP